MAHRHLLALSLVSRIKHVHYVSAGRAWPGGELRRRDSRSALDELPADTVRI